jgi:acetylornithine/succinyldiaminopimelate/putrescine aminotransferase
VTEKRNSQPFFEPYLPDVHFATFNDIESVHALVSDKTAAIIVEPVQGEGGLAPATPQFLMALRQLCDEQNICLIFDEVQTGFGRLGEFNAYDAFKCCGEYIDDGDDVATDKAASIMPDIATWAKGMGGGFPVGAMGAKEKFGKAIIVGTHGTTYGGNPLACAVCASVCEELLTPGFMENVRHVSEILVNGLDNMKRGSNKITEIRGKGLMLGVNTVFDTGQLIGALQKNGLMTTMAGGGTVRLTPPLILTEEQAKEGLAIIEKTLNEMDE